MGDMISDVLFEALVRMDDYQLEMRDIYDEFAAEIDVVKTIMKGLQMFFDAPPEFEAQVEDIRAAIRAVDISGLVAAHQRLLTWVAEERNRSGDSPSDGSAAPAGANDWLRVEMQTPICINPFSSFVSLLTPSGEGRGLEGSIPCR